MCGPVGTGKLDFAFALARAELCEVSYHTDDNSSGCGKCQSCLLFDAGTHPDFHFLANEVLTNTLQGNRMVCANRHLPERPKSRKLVSSLIAVDRIRHLNEVLSLRPFTQRKFALIAPADGMNVQAANALLKLLEEPPADTRMVLLSARIFRIPATIRSRTSRIQCDAPVHELGVNWLLERGVDREVAIKLLKVCGGGPLQALALQQRGYHLHLGELENAVIAILERESSANDLASAWAKRAKDGFTAEDVIPILRSILDELARRNQLTSKNADDKLQAVAAGLHLKRLHEATLKLSALVAGWDSVLDNTLLLEQAFSVVQSARG